MNTLAATAMAAKNQRCHPAAPARKLNAAPVLYASTRLMKLVTGSSWPSRKSAVIHALVARSATITSAASSSQRHQRELPCAEAVMVSAVTGSRAAAGRCVESSCELPDLAGAEEVRDAPGAQLRVLRIRTDVGAPVPAALALRVRTRRDADRELRPRCKGGRRRDRH